MVAISIIMPVYNSEKYIEKTINSILSQSYSNFELLLIDDGSKDESGMICDKYAAKDERVRVVHKKNEGICATRNVGLSMARGEYIAFCDNDVYRVSTGCLAENIGSERVMQKCGFIKEAEHIDYEWHDGKIKTRLEYRLLKKEWLD